MDREIFKTAPIQNQNLVLFDMLTDLTIENPTQESVNEQDVYFHLKSSFSVQAMYLVKQEIKEIKGADKTVIEKLKCFPEVKKLWDAADLIEKYAKERETLTKKTK